MSNNVLAIGNAITDIVCNIDKQFLLNSNLVEGSMSLIDQNKVRNFSNTLSANVIVAGGSAGNTASALGWLGVSTSFFGVLGSDKYADIFVSSMQESKVKFIGKNLSNEDSATSFILVTQNGERTMATNLASAANFYVADMQKIVWQNFNTIYIEGYLYDTKNTIDAINYAINQALKYNIKTAFSLSDLFCVTRHKQDFLSLLPKINLLFANRLEISNLCSDQQFNLNEIQQFCRINQNLTIIITDSGNGCFVVNKQNIINVATKKITPLDTTGAGDIFAAGFLYGLQQNYSLLKSAEIANFLAGKIIQQYGARFDTLQINTILQQIKSYAK
jgi:sugar/nucleoside kinase (ribokinase family)